MINILLGKNILRHLPDIFTNFYLLWRMPDHAPCRSLFLENLQARNMFKKRQHLLNLWQIWVIIDGEISSFRERFGKRNCFWGMLCNLFCGNIPLAFYIYLQNGLDFLIEIWSSSPSFNRSILTPLYLNFWNSVHAQITITRYYIIFPNFLAWH